MCYMLLGNFTHLKCKMELQSDRLEVPGTHEWTPSLRGYNTVTMQWLVSICILSMLSITEYIMTIIAQELPLQLDA